MYVPLPLWRGHLDSSIREEREEAVTEGSKTTDEVKTTPEEEEKTCEEKLKALEEEKKALQEKLKKQEGAPAEEEGAAAPPAGQITAGKKHYLAELLAYEALERVAGAVCTAITDKKLSGIKVLLVRDRALAQGGVPLIRLTAAFARYKADVKGQLAAVNGVIGRICPPVDEADKAGGESKPPENVFERAGFLLGGPLGAAGDVIKAAADAMSYLASEWTITEQAVTLSDEALTAAVAGGLAEGKVSAYVQDFWLLKKSPIVQAFADLCAEAGDLRVATAKLKACAQHKEAEVAKLDEEIKALETTIADLEKAIKARETKIKTASEALEKLKQATPPDPEAIAAAEKALASLQAEQKTQETALAEAKKALAETNAKRAAADALKKEADKVVTGAEELIEELTAYGVTITTPGESTPSLLTLAALRGYVDEGRFTHLLHVGVVSGGGESVHGKGLLLMNKISYSGGCAVQYLLAEPDGKVVVGGIKMGASRFTYHLAQMAEAVKGIIDFIN